MFPEEGRRETFSPALFIITSAWHICVAVCLDPNLTLHPTPNLCDARRAGVSAALLAQQSKLADMITAQMKAGRGLLTNKPCKGMEEGC